MVIQQRFPRIRNQTVTTTAAVLVEANPKRVSLLVYNVGGTGTVYLGSNKYVTTSNGMPIPAGAVYTNNDFDPNGEYWIIGGGSDDVRIEEDILA